MRAYVAVRLWEVGSRIDVVSIADWRVIRHDRLAEPLFGVVALRDGFYVSSGWEDGIRVWNKGLPVQRIHEAGPDVEIVGAGDTLVGSSSRGTFVWRFVGH